MKTLKYKATWNKKTSIFKRRSKLWIWIQSQLVLKKPNIGVWMMKWDSVGLIRSLYSLSMSRIKWLQSSSVNFNRTSKESHQACQPHKHQAIQQLNLFYQPEGQKVGKHSKWNWVKVLLTDWARKEHLEKEKTWWTGRCRRQRQRRTLRGYWTGVSKMHSNYNRLDLRDQTTCKEGSTHCTSLLWVGKTYMWQAPIALCHHRGRK